MKLWPHVNAFQAGVREAATGAAGIKVLDHSDPTWLRSRRNAGAFTLGRVYVPFGYLTESTVDAYADQVLDMWTMDAYSAVEFANEERQGSRAEIASLAALTVRFCRRVRPHGVRVVGGNFSMGNPNDLSWWDAFRPALDELDYLGLHEYSRPTMQTDASWHCLRYRRVHDYLRGDHPPVVITECGLDWGGDGARDGWRARGVSAEDYAAQLRWYDQELQRDPYVLGAAVYCLGQFGDWWSFDLRGEPALYVWKGDGVTIEERLKVLEDRTKTLGDQNEAIRVALSLILQGRWNGEMPHADAFVKSLTTNPEKNDWSAVSFPK